MKVNDYRVIVSQALTDTFEKKAPKLLQEAVSSFIGKKGGYPSGSNKLRTNSGRLLDSLNVGSSENIFEVEIKNDKIVYEYGTKVPYALIQEEGGTIQPTEKMVKFFWAKYYSTKETYYRNLALRAKAGKSFRIKSRPFLNPGIAKFEEESLPKLIDEFVKEVLNKLAK